MSNELMFKAALYCASNIGYITEGRSFILNKDSGSIYSAKSGYCIAGNEEVISDGKTLRTYVKDLFDDFPNDVYYIQHSSVSKYTCVGYCKDLSLRHVNGAWEKVLHPIRSDLSFLIPRSLLVTCSLPKFPVGSWCVHKGDDGIMYIEGYSIDGNLIVSRAPDSLNFTKVNGSEFEPIDSEEARIIRDMITSEPHGATKVERMKRLMEVVLKHKGL